MGTIATAPLVVIVGETSSGKSQIGMHIAEQFGGEIIAADAWTVYKCFDIGTAKPSAQDRVRVQHHVVNVFEPTQHCNVAEYKELALRAIDEVSSRGNIPMLVGGTGLYVDSIIYDYQFRAGVNPSLRQSLNTMTNEQLRHEVTRLGLSTNNIDMANNRRVIRHIESQGIAVGNNPLRKNILVLGLAIPKDELDERIILRVETMFRSGLVLEVQLLAKEYGWDIAPMQAIGYREFRMYFEGKQTLDETKALIIQNTRRLAKKQRTWFRRNKSIQWVNEYTEAVELVTTFLNNYRR